MSLVGLDGRPLETAEAHSGDRMLLVEAFGALLGLHPQPGHKWKDSAQLAAYREAFASSLVDRLGRDVLQARFKIKITTQEGT